MPPSATAQSRSRADETRADEAQAILRNNGAFDIDDRVVQWRSEGWTGYDPNVEPFSFEEIQRHRTRYSPRTGQPDSTMRG